MRRLNHHLAGEPTGGVENFVATIDAVKPHHASNRVNRIVAAHVLDKVQKLGRCAEQGAAVYRTRLLVNCLVFTHEFRHRIERALRQRRIGRELNIIDVRHQIAKHRAAAAAGSLSSMRHLFVEINEPALGVDGG